MSTLNPENKCAHLVEGEVETPSIKDMFRMQRDLQKFYASMGKATCPDETAPDKRVADISRQWRNLTLEFAELLERLPFKEWKTYSHEDYVKAFSGEEMLETKFEYIDMFHFFMNIGLMLGIDGDEFAKLYYLKNKENYARQERGY